MKKVIIGIHGLENKPSIRLLSEWWKQSMMEGMVAIGKYHELPEFELVYWADTVYDKPLNPDITDEKDPYYLDELYTPVTVQPTSQVHSFRLKVTGFVIRQLKRVFLNEDLSMKNKAIADNIVERYFRELDIYYKHPCNEPGCNQCKAKSSMVERVVTALRKYKGYEILLIGHSMGSILGFDAICFETPEVEVDTFVTLGSPIGLPIVVSRIAERQKGANKRSTAIQTPEAIRRQWLNYSDIEDMVAINHKLGQEFVPNNKGVNPIDVLVQNTYTMNGKRNPHSIFGYLRSPEFSRVLSAFIEQQPPTMTQRAVNILKGLFGKRK